MNRCPDPACAEAFDLLLAREFGDPASFAVHHLTVAAYRLEHPAGSSDHTLATLLCVLRAGVDDGRGGEALRRYAAWAGRRLRERPPGPVPRPAGRARLGAVDVAAAPDAAGHCALVRAWAAQVREVWRPVADGLALPR